MMCMSESTNRSPSFMAPSSWPGCDPRGRDAPTITAAAWESRRQRPFCAPDPPLGASAGPRLQAAGEDLRHRFGREAELQERDADVEVLAVRGDPAALELERAHAPKSNLLARAAGHGLAHHVAE